jgi:hypothetical protein
MLSRSLPFALTAALTASVSGCATGPMPGSIAYYVAAPSAGVKTTCGGEYKVFRRRGEQRLLVAAYAIPEALQTMCEQRRGLQPSLGITGVRHEEAAVEYISETPALKGCTVASGIEITHLHSEFVLGCPAEPGSKAPEK